jgi:hypothetical protein
MIGRGALVSLCIVSSGCAFAFGSPSPGEPRSRIPAVVDTAIATGFTALAYEAAQCKGEDAFCHLNNGLAAVSAATAFLFGLSALHGWTAVSPAPRLDAE